MENWASFVILHSNIIFWNRSAFLRKHQIPSRSLKESFSGNSLEISECRAFSPFKTFPGFRAFRRCNITLCVSCQEPQMAAVQITFVKTLQRKFQEIYYTILKYKNEIIFVPSFVFIGLFLRIRCFRKEA